MNPTKKSSRLPIYTVIEKLSHDGRGIARIDGKITFIQGALPGESVIFEYTRQKKDFDEGKVISIEKASDQRATPQCNHYSVCGGCSMQHMNAEMQIMEKEAQLLDLLSRFAHVQPAEILSPLTSDLWNYRNKARLSAKFVQKKNSVLVGFREKNNPRYIAEISHCPVIHARVGDELEAMRALIASFEKPDMIAQIEVAAGDREVALILRNLTDLSPTDEEKIQAFSEKTGFRIFLQPGGPDSVFLLYPKKASEYLSYELPEEKITFSFHPVDFTQVNSNLNRLMVKHALHLLDLQATDRVLDLFCGLGNFSLPIARHCSQVLGVEGTQTMVERAYMNARNNQIQNAEFLCANLEDETSFSAFTHFKANKVLLDPPRTGALAIVKHINLLKPERIVYVSCNPATLARDTDILVNQHGYFLKAAGVMDMFPHTAHVESIALFEKK